MRWCGFLLLLEFALPNPFNRLLISGVSKLSMFLLFGTSRSHLARVHFFLWQLTNNKGLTRDTLAKRRKRLKILTVYFV